MVESNAYKIGTNGETLLMKDVNKMGPVGEGKWRMETILGEEIIVEGELLEVDFGGHKILLESK